MDQAKPPKNKNYWLGVGLKMFAESTGWIAFPVIAALYLGRYLDGKQNSGHLYFFVLTAIAFIVSCLGLVKTGQKYLRQLDTSQSKEKNSNHEPRDQSNK
ncbi:MAG: AtpZ/AtpI family protein [Patescibacteria group bacterium]